MNATVNPSELSLDQLRPVLAEAMLPHVPFDGWTPEAASRAAKDIGIDPKVAQLAFGGKATLMIEAMQAAADKKMLAAIDTPEFQTLKIREKVTRAIWTRFENARPHREALRRASAILAMPQNSVLAGRLAWRTAKAIWAGCNDKSADFSWYTRRAIAASVYTSTLLYWLHDDSEDQQETKAFLDRRIADVMRFEKAKAQWRNSAAMGERLSLSRFLGRLRYPQQG